MPALTSVTFVSVLPLNNVPLVIENSVPAKMRFVPYTLFVLVAATVRAAGVTVSVPLL